MITCEPSDNGFVLAGLSLSDLDILDEALCMAFAVNLNKEHRRYRTAILQIHQPISDQIDKLSTENEPTLF
jgi:hypothetical protein